MDAETLKKEIEQIGNIKVFFEPSNYRHDLIPKKDLPDIMQKAQVSLRGWNFPHIPNQNREDSKAPYSIGTGIEFFTCWDKFAELFRFYQSGQFLGKFALLEDTLGTLDNKKLEPGKYLDFLSLIYKFTEIILFVRNLVEILDISGQITIEINKTKGRELESLFRSNILSFHAGYICQIDKILISAKFSKEEILNNYREIALRLIKDVFDDFNWRTYSDQMIKTHQENLLNRRV